MLIDFHGLEVWLGLPAFRVIGQALGPHQRALPLARRADPIVCPQCQTGCARVQASRPRCLRDLPMLERPVMLWLHLRRFACPDCRQRPWETRETCRERTPWTERRDTQGRAACLGGCPCKARARRSGLSARPVCRWTFERCRGGRPRTLGRVMGIEE